MGLFMAISVGPTLFAVIRYSLNHSYKAGLAFVLGVSASDIIYVTLANLATPWLEALHRYEKWLAYGGGTILLIMGIAGLLSKQAPHQPSEKLVTISRKHYFQIAGSGFLINTINPGVVINWLGAVTIIANQNILYRLVFFGVCLGIVLGIDFLKVLLADSIRKSLTPRIVTLLQKISALVLFLFGAFLLIVTFFHLQIGSFSIA